MHNLDKWITDWRAGLAGSEWLRQSDVTELETHLREEMEHLKTAGLRDDEAFLIARRRLGDTGVLKERLATVDPRQRVSNRLYWMILGILSYYVLGPLNSLLSPTIGYLAYQTSLRGAFLTYFATIAGIVVYTLVVYLLMRYLASHWCSRIMTKGTAASICVGVLAVGVNLVLCWIAGLAHYHVWSWSAHPTEHRATMTLPASSAAVVWCATMMFLFAGTLAIFARRSRAE